LDSLQARPQRLDRVEVGRVGRQPLDHEPVPLALG
jgi:hypothetical protein